MTFLRALWSDLVEKRLWPVALALVIALVAVPVVLTRSSGGEELAPLPPAAPALAVEDPPVDAVEVVATTSTRKPTGSYHDPFTGGPPSAGPAEQAAAAGSSAAAAGASALAAGAASSATPAATAAGAASSATAPTASPAPPAQSPTAEPTPTRSPGVPAGWLVDIAWGHPGAVVTRRDLLRLKVLRTESRHTPAVIYLGVSEDHRAAYFVPIPGVVTWGDGRCLPSRADCEVVRLRKGRTQMFDVPSGDGVTHYQLDVDRIVARRAATAYAASEARSDVSESGRDLLARIVSEARDYLASLAYSARRGVVRRLSTPRASAAETTPEPVTEPAAPADLVPSGQ
jgi:hypothetical protein